MNPWRLPLLYLALTVLLAGGLRFADLENRPRGINSDELLMGYSAWSLATTGGVLDVSYPDAQWRCRVKWRALPWMFESIGPPITASYQYASLPFMWTGGLTIASTRRAAALAGTLAVLLAGLIFMRAWGAWPGLAVASWLALSHWHLVHSRWGVQGIFVPLLMLPVLGGLWGVENRRRWGWPVAAGGMGWLFYSYAGAQPFVPVWGACLIALYGRRLFSLKTLKSPEIWLAVAMFLLPVLPTVAGLLGPSGADRMKAVGILSRADLSWGGRASMIWDNYWEHFDSWYLFKFGDANPRHGVPGLGQLHWADAVLLPLGIALAFWRRAPLRGALAAALICGPIPSAITNDGVPHAIRSIAMIVPVVAFSGWAIAEIASGLGRLLLRIPIAPRARRPLAALGVVALLLPLYVHALRDVACYWRLAGGDPAIQLAFNDSQCRVWQRLSAGWRPGQRIWDDCTGHLYYRLFFLRIPPREAEPAGPLPNDYRYIGQDGRPLEAVRAAMRPGDWLIYSIDPHLLKDRHGDPWIKTSLAEQARRPWSFLWQKPPAESGK